MLGVSAASFLVVLRLGAVLPLAARPVTNRSETITA
jgi:hypothetical protein